MKAFILSGNQDYGPSITIGPNVHIGEGVDIGEGTIILGNTFIFAGVKIGKNVVIKPNCTIGGYGFLYKKEDGVLMRGECEGTTIIEDDVHIGSNTAIDRGRVQTILRRGCKIDNLVHIAHDCDVGENSIIIAGTIVGGHVTIGKDCKLSINSSIRNRMVIGDNSIVCMHTRVIDNMTPGTKIGGRNGS